MDANPLGERRELTCNVKGSLWPSLEEDIGVWGRSASLEDSARLLQSHGGQ